MKPLAPRPHRQNGRLALMAAAATLACTASAAAQGLSGIGVVGGLVVPDARSLGVGTIALGLSNAPEPQWGRQDVSQSFLLGVGLLPGLDVVGRIAEYQTRRSDGFGLSGISDLGVNVKYSLALGQDPEAWRIAVGVQDLGGASGGNKFNAQYAVTTLPFRGLDFTLGVGRPDQSKTFFPGTKLALDGLFGGVSYRLPLGEAKGALSALAALGGQASLHAEFDGRQPLVGARWTSAPVPVLANARFSAALHHAFESGARNPAATVWTLGLSVPFGANERARGRPAAPEAAGVAGGAAPAGLTAGAPPETRPMAVPAAAAEAAPARLARLKAALVAQGFERVRVGRQGPTGWVVEYQNRRFSRNEMDALGVATGLAARAAPDEVQGLVVVALRQDQPVLTLRTEPAAWRRFLETGLTAPLADVTRVQRGRSASAAEADWLSDTPTAGTRAQVQISPELSYAVATEYGFVDYSLAARVRATVPVDGPAGWKGLQMVAIAQGRVANSDQAEPGGAFPTLMQQQGLQVLALQQTYWLGRRAVLSGSVGRFEYGGLGGEGEAIVFVPGRDDVIRLRGRLLDRTASMPRGFDQAGSTVYRWVGAPGLWAEAGWHRYTDGSQGPSLSVVRWWGDLGVQMSYRRGGYQGGVSQQFVGVDFIFPLTPRSVRSVGPVHVEGRAFQRQGLRTMVGNTSNWVLPRAAREMQPAWDIDSNTLNGGRLGPEYVMSQLGRMREAFFLYAEEK